MAGGWSARARMSGPLVEYVEGFEAELVRAGYAPGSVGHQLRRMAHLDGWLEAGRLDAAGLTDAVVERFLSEHRAAGIARSGATSLSPLLEHLREMGVAPPAAVLAQSAAERLLGDYRRFLVRERGLSAGTARGYAVAVGPLLACREGAGGLDLQRLGARDVTRFLVARRQMLRGREVVTALRSLLGFLALEGLVEEDLAAAVPSVASWRLAGIPPTLAPGQARLLLSSCDRATALGRRDFAILTILARLGLRRGEVAALSLDDLRWRAGEIVLSNRKRARRETLPLPVDVGEAISNYLRAGRPARALTRSLFVRANAPLRGLSSAGVGSVVAAACDRAGIERVGAHRLRHSVASDILRAGAGLEEVGQVLGHRLPRTTAIYAKVDLRALRLIARPWPGGAS